MKKTFAFLLLALAVCLSFGAVAQEIGDIVPLPHTGGPTGDWRDQIPVALVGSFAVMLSGTLTMALTEKAKQALEKFGIKTQVLNAIINAVIVAILFLILGKATSTGDIIAYLVTTVLSFLVDQGTYKMRLHIAQKATEPRLG